MRAAVVAGDSSVDEALATVTRAAVDGRACARRRRLGRASRTSTPTSGDVEIAVVDYGAKRSILRRLAGAGRRRDRLPARRRRRRRSPATTACCSRTGPGDPEPLVDEVAERARAARPHAACSASASATSCSRSRPATRRSSCRSATAARTTRCSSARPAACSSRARTTASRSRRARTREATHVSLYDGTVEGLDFPELRARSVQFHPEAGPGPARRLAAPRDLGRGACRAAA